MVKKVVSFSLSENTLKKLDETSRALGMSRSELLEFMLRKGWHFSEQMVETVNEIANLQRKAKKRIG